MDRSFVCLATSEVCHISLGTSVFSWQYLGASGKLGSILITGRYAVRYFAQTLCYLLYAILHKYVSIFAFLKIFSFVHLNQYFILYTFFPAPVLPLESSMHFLGIHYVAYMHSFKAKFLFLYNRLPKEGFTSAIERIRKLLILDAAGVHSTIAPVMLTADRQSIYYAAIWSETSLDSKIKAGAVFFKITCTLVRVSLSSALLVITPSCFPPFRCYKETIGKERTSCQTVLVVFLFQWSFVNLNKPFAVFF